MQNIVNKIIAVDFDGTITLDSPYPITGKPNMNMVNLIKKLQVNNKIILWTCREGKYLEEALNICSSLGIVFDEVNENIDKTSSSRKIYADYYIDDKAVNVLDILKEE